jgi:uncharacterized RDD family membrane protein YckC
MSGRHPWRRLAAWLLDCLCVLGWVVLVAAIGVPLYLAGAIRPTGLLLLNAIGAVLIVVPVTLGLAALEARFGATWGKRVLGLRVEAVDGAPPSFGRALVRNALKVALPWLIGHAAVFAVVTAPSAGADVLLALAYVLPILWIVTVIVPPGRTPYDRIAGDVVAADPAAETAVGAGAAAKAGNGLRSQRGARGSR